MLDLIEFLDPVPVHQLNNDEGYTDGQLGKHIDIYEEELPNVEEAEIILMGITENRGNSFFDNDDIAANLIRKHLYQLHYWHSHIKIADIGNVKKGDEITDSYAAIRTILAELLKKKKTVLLLGGSHDITLAQYGAYIENGKQIEATCIDAMIDLRGESPVRSQNFLLDMLTGEPSMVKHYNHIAFQSYFVHPRMLETMDKLRFDCFRVGTVTESIDEMEPVLRNTNLLSFDMNALKYSDAPANKNCPNGLTGIDACMLTRFAGMSDRLSSFGIYGYRPQDDVGELTARQISQMIWYFFDGRYKSLQEANFDDRNQFNEFHTLFGEVDTLFLQSKRTGRWWMQMPDQEFIACSQRDYLQAKHNDIPERWLRTQERN
ncbi:MAG TPA: arginase family protein [Ferruginibacter sp.]|nr:arginase family protein [Ferruginibacter sp.]HRE63114.1 arginase family protein [Ferruginibacter sp.]